MVVAKRTIKNQLTLPKAVVEQAGIADYYDVVCDNGRMCLRPCIQAVLRLRGRGWLSWASARQTWPRP